MLWFVNLQPSFQFVKEQMLWKMVLKLFTTFIVVAVRFLLLDFIS